MGWKEKEWQGNEIGSLMKIDGGWFASEQQPQGGLSGFDQLAGLSGL